MQDSGGLRLGGESGREQAREDERINIEPQRDGEEEEGEQASSSRHDSTATLRRQRESLDSNAAVGPSRHSVGGREPSGRLYLDDELENIKQSLMLMHEQMEKNALSNTKVERSR